jgi:hypothetical protein
MAGDGAGTRVAHGPLLLEFAEAMLGTAVSRQIDARTSVAQTLGRAALVDAAAVVASFNAVVKIADATGIPIEAGKADATRDLREELALDRLLRPAH